MIKLQIISIILYLFFSIVFFIIGRKTAIKTINNPNNIYVKFANLLIWIFGIILFGFLIYIWKRLKKFNLDENLFLFRIFELEINVDGNLLALLIIVVFSIFAFMEGAYRMVLKSKYEKYFYLYVAISSILLFYITFFVELPKKTFPIGTYDGYLNPKIVKMKIEEEKKIELQNEKSNEHQ